MGACGKGISQCILLTTNTLIFLIAAGSLGVSVYFFHDIAALAMTKFPLLVVVAIAAVVLMIFSCLGCKTALNAPQKRCSRCLYLSTLLVLFIAEFVAAGYIFNFGHALEVAKEHRFDVRSAVHLASEDALVFLHNSLNDLYVAEKCAGGGQFQKKLPFNFTEVQCKTKSSTQAFHSLFHDSIISTAHELQRYENCTADPSFDTGILHIGTNNFTQAFCGSEAHIASLANQYAGYLVWFPVCLAALTLIHLVATICMMAQKTHRDRSVRTLRGAQEPLHRVQIASP